MHVSNKPEIAKIILTDFGKSADLSDAHVIDATPSAGIAPSIAVSYLIERFKPAKIAEIRSQHFPHVSLVSNGIASCPKIELYMHEDEQAKLILISRNFTIDDSETGYLIADMLHSFLAGRKALNYYLLTGARLTGERGVYIASANLDDAKLFLKSGAKLLRSLEEIPADKLSTYLMHLYSRRTGRAWLLVAEVMPYFPDPAAAKDLLEILSRALRFEVDLKKLEEEIEKQRALVNEFRRDYERMVQERIKGDRKPLYIG